MKVIILFLLLSHLVTINAFTQDSIVRLPTFTVVHANAESAPDVGVELKVTDEKGNAIASAPVIVKRDGGGVVVEFTTDQEGKFKMQETTIRRFYKHNSDYLFEVKSSPGKYLGSYAVMSTYGITSDTMMQVTVRVITEPCYIHPASVTFKRKSAGIDSTQQAELGAIYMFVNSNPEMDFNIIILYDKKSEARLALERGLAVQDQLTAWGIDIARISVVTYKRAEATDDCGKKIHTLASNIAWILVPEI